MDIDEIAVALMDASIGYHTATSAVRHAEDYLNGETECGCERCLALYHGDLPKAVESDLRYWSGLPEERKERVRRLLRATRGRPWAEQATASMLYPTAVLGPPFLSGGGDRVRVQGNAEAEGTMAVRLP